MKEAEIRAWLVKIVEVLKTGASLTPTVVDDNVCDAVLKALASDFTWRWLWRLIGRWMDDEPVDLIVAADEMPIPVSAEDKLVVEAINPMLVLAVIQAAVALIKALRNK